MKYTCPKCGSLVTTDKKYISQGYFGACLNCDEDFFSFEVIEIADKITCGSCEKPSKNPTTKNECPHCGSGNWVYGDLE